MSAKLKLVVGSLVGAVAVHVALIACNNAPSTPEIEDAGLLDAMIDALTNMVDSSTKDAKADPDASSCSCAPTTSGSRLKGMFTSGADGSRYYKANVWWDSTLQTQCASPTLDVDSKLHCLPSGVAVPRVLYADAACTQRVAVLAAGETADKHASEYLVQNVATLGAVQSSKTAVYALGAPTTAPATGYAFYTAGNCGSAAVTPGQQWFDVGALSPASEFVEMSEGHD
jgi:hypothetical protein